MDQITYVVTGANTGIGKAVALALAREGRHVVITRRDPQKGAAALADIRQAGAAAAADLVIGDLSTIAGTQDLADALLARFPSIGVLINNAGVWLHRRELNKDGIECSFMVNNLAPFILSRRLLPRLKANAPARIVNVNAGLYANGKLDLDQTPYGGDFSRLRTYADTKLCNVLFTLELARRIAGSGVTVNAVHPGVIRTNLGDTGGPLGFLLRVAKRFWAEPEAGAKPVVWLATSPELAGVNGRYFDLMAVADLAENARDDDLRRELWAFTAACTDMEEYEP